MRSGFISADLASALQGVYLKGRIRQVDVKRRRARLRVGKYSQHSPLTDAPTSALLANAVAARSAQVFIFPDIVDAKQCLISSINGECYSNSCESCPSWRHLPRIGPRSNSWPHRLPEIEGFAAAYWVIPSRCYVMQSGGKIKESIRRTSELFYRFKFGESQLAYPLALGIANSLDLRGLHDFECIVPIPLSPNKQKAGEINRTARLSKELSSLLDVPVSKLLSLKWSISKHTLRTHQHLSAVQFELKYLQALNVRPVAKRYRRILLLDDVATEGSTLRCAVERIASVNPDCEIVAASAGHMVLRNTVRPGKSIMIS